MAISKTEAVKDAMANLGAGVTAAAVQAFVKSQHGLTVSKTYVYNLSGSKKRPKTAVNGTLNGKHAEASKTLSKGGIAISDIQKVTELTMRIGADNLHALVAVLER